MFTMSSYGQSGQDGNISWSVASGTLTISGSGVMKDYDYNDGNAAPWVAHMSFVRRIIIQEGISTIGSCAFALCPSVTSVEMPNTIEGIGNSAFLGCSGLIDIEIPDNVQEIRALAFGGCRNLTNIDVPEKVTIIGEGAFSGCTGLLSINVNANNPVFKSIDGIVFSKDGSILSVYPAGKKDKSYTVPSNVTEIGYGAFLNCGNLVKVEMSDGVQVIGREAFLNCQSLDTVIIPASVNNIESGAFKYCDNLKVVEVKWLNPLLINSNVFPEDINAELIIPDGTKDAYDAAEVWKNFRKTTEKSTVDNSIAYVSDVKALIVNGILIIDSPNSEKINIYNLAGTLVDSFVKGEGMARFSASSLSNGIYIIRGSKGWSVKVSMF